MVQHLKDMDGRVHFAGTTQDHMLCGFNNDGDAQGTSDRVDCPECRDVVEHCQRIRDSERLPLSAPPPANPYPSLCDSGGELWDADEAS